MTDTPPVVPGKGRSLWSDAWRRLRKNKLAVISMVFIGFVGVTGYSAPIISAHVTHFSAEEAHSRLLNKPPGTRDISVDHPTYDGNKDAFAVADVDGDGFIACEKTETGAMSCPELKLLEYVAQNHFDFLFNRYDTRKSGPDGTLLDGHRPDGYLVWEEFPKDDEDIRNKDLRGLGLSGPDAFAKLDIDGDNVITTWEVTEQSRHLRYSALDPTEGRTFRRFVVEHDADNDLRISAAEYPGAPALHTFHFGTDGQGRDVLTRLFYGARMSITIALLATLVSLFIGVSYGAIAGYFGGRVDNIMMRIVDIMYGLPFLFIIILVMVMVGRNMIVFFICLGAVQWLNMARVVRGQVISLKNQEFVEAARAIGVGGFSIVFRHLIRNAVGPVVVYATLLVPAVILEEAFLAFLGFGLDHSWGLMISEGKDVMAQFPWLIIFPGVALAMTLFAMNFLGDGVRDAIDPKQAS